MICWSWVLTTSATTSRAASCCGPSELSACKGVPTVFLLSSSSSIGSASSIVSWLLSSKSGATTPLRMISPILFLTGGDCEGNSGITFKFEDRRCFNFRFRHLRFWTKRHVLPLRMIRDTKDPITAPIMMGVLWLRWIEFDLLQLIMSSVDHIYGWRMVGQSQFFELIPWRIGSYNNYEMIRLH